MIEAAESQRVGSAWGRQDAEAVGNQVVAEQLQSYLVVLADDDAGDLSAVRQHRPPKPRAEKTLPPAAPHRGVDPSERDLQYSDGAPAPGEAARRQRPADHQRLLGGVEEEEVELEAHAEAVDAGTAWDQQPATGSLAGDPGEAEQASAPAAGDRDFDAEHGAAGEGRQARVLIDVHAALRRRRAILSPAGCNPPFRGGRAKAPDYDDRHHP